MSVVVQETAAPVVRQRTRRDSFVVVHEAMQQVHAKGYCEEGLLRSILGDLKELVERAERVKQLAPELAGVDVSPFIYQMLKMADQKRF